MKFFVEIHGQANSVEHIYLAQEGIVYGPFESVAKMRDYMRENWPPATRFLVFDAEICERPKALTEAKE